MTGPAPAPTPVDEALNALFDHCVHCLGCKVGIDSPGPPPTCPEAEALYQAWFILWRKEARR